MNFFQSHCTYDVANKQHINKIVNKLLNTYIYALVCVCVPFWVNLYHEFFLLIFIFFISECNINFIFNL